MKHFLSLTILLAIFLSGTFFLSPVFAVDAIEELNSRIENKKEEIKNIEASIAELDQKLKENQTQAQSLKNQISILDNRKVAVEYDINRAQSKLDSLDLQLQVLGLEIVQKEDSIARQKDILAELLRDIHRSEQKNSLEVFVAYDNFSDFYNQVQAVKTVEREIGRMAKNVRLEKEDLELKQQQTEEIKIETQKTKEELNAKRQSLLDQTYLKNDLLVKTKSSEAVYQTLLKTQRSQYQQIESEIVGIEQEKRQILEAAKKLEDTSDDDSASMSWPAPSKYITAYFHDPSYPYRNVFEHSGIDIRAGHGTQIRAASSGYIARAKYCSAPSCYSFIMIVHANGLSTVYGHMSALYVKEDEFVARGDVIGLSGGTPGTNGAGPFVTGPHLHFEVRNDGVPVNALNYLSQ